MSNNDISFEITEKIAVLNAYSNGWNREVNVVVWNNAAPKIDIRDWSPDHMHMTRGITLNEAESEKLAKALGERAAEKKKAEKRRDSYER